MSLPLFGEIEKLIHEHGDAAILKERLALARDEYDALETRRSKLELENAQLKERIQSLEDQIAMSQPRRIEELQEQILILLADAPRMTTDQLAKQLHLEMDLASSSIKGLEAAKLVVGHHVVLLPTQWSLGQDGRRYLSSNGLIG